MFFFVYLRFNESVYDTLVYLKKKKYEQHVHSFCCFICVKCDGLVYNGLKQSLILQSKPNRFLQIS